MDRGQVIRRGNIVTTQYPEQSEIGRYQGNGRFGAVMAGLGLNRNPAVSGNETGSGASRYMHLQHWGRFKFTSAAMAAETTADYIVPLMNIHWEKEPARIRGYRQCQDFYDGVVETSFESEENNQVKVLTWFDMVNKNMAGVRLDISNGVLPVKASALTEFIPYSYLYRELVQQSVDVRQQGDNWCVTVKCEQTLNQLQSAVYFYSTAPVEVCSDGLRFLPGKGSHTIVISYGTPVKAAEASGSLERTIERWHDIWEQGGWFDFPYEQAQQVWVRSMAYLLETFQDNLGIMQPTNGFTGNIFPFNFVQDLQYCVPALLMTGHVKIVKGWVEQFAGNIPGMKAYTKTLWPEAEGIYPPWELPYGETPGYHHPAVPIIFCYEPHNAGYLCRMARETADYVCDPEWTEQFVWPLIQELCRFYRSLCCREADGRWHLECSPSIGQDEAGGQNQKDYLCCLYSAKYCFETAVAAGLDEQGFYAEVLRDGLAFDSLKSDQGIYHTAAGADDFGKQKHPVQLNGVAYFPTEKAPLPPEQMAYKLRYELTARAKEPYFFGWTLGEFLLAGSNMKSVEGWQKDWDQLRRSDYTDSHWVQFYETSGAEEKSFYVTTHGLIAQSLMRNYVNDYWGNVEIAACPVFDGPVRFGQITVRSGVRLSGVIQDGQICMEAVARQDGCWVVNDRQVTMKAGETCNLQWLNNL